MKKLLLLSVFLFSQGFLFAQSNYQWVDEIDMDPYYDYFNYNFNNPTDVIYDDNGALWSSFKVRASSGYISKYKDNIYTVFSLDSANFPATDVRDLCIENGIIYAATDSGIVKYDGTNWEIYLNVNSGLHSNYVYGMDIQNGIIYARTDTVVNIYDISNNSFSYVFLPTSYNYWHTTSIKRAVYIDNENLYVGDTNCVYLINDDTITAVYSIDNLSDRYINDIKFTSSGQMYVSSYSFVYKLVGNELKNIVGILNPIYTGIYFLQSNYNILIYNDTIYAVDDRNLMKFTDDNYCKTYYDYQNTSSSPYNVNFAGVLFVDNDGNICIKNNMEYYKRFDFSKYANVASTTQDNHKCLDINNVNACVSQNEVAFWFNGIPCYEVPKGSGKHSNFASTLWITAEDEYSLIYCAAGTYNDNGFDFYPGPLKDDGTTDSLVSSNYNKLWKINRMDIEEMRYRYDNGLITQPGYQIPEDILTWPANGDVSDGYSQNLAPYYDANGDNIYNVYDGDYPIIHGDQEIYSISNDNLTEHSESYGVPLKIEIHRSFYAYSCSVATDSTDEINYTTFLHYKIINKSNKTYLDTKFGLFGDADIGYASNDLVGSNVDLKSYYFYNQRADGDGLLNTYGENPPALSYTFLKGPKADNADWKDNDNDGQIDELGETCDFNNFLYFINSGGPIVGDPSAPIDYFYFMRSKWKDGSPLKYGSFNNTTDTNALFSFSGNSDTNLYSTSGIDPGFAWFDTNQGDKRGIGSMGPITFEPGDTAEFDIAIVWSRDTTDLIDSNNVQKLFRDIANVRYWYDNNIDVSCLELDTSSIGISTVQNNVDFDIYPNPVKDYLNIEYSDYKDASCRIVDLNGKLILEQKIISEKTILNTKYLPKGIYIITIYSKNATISKKFIK